KENDLMVEQCLADLANDLVGEWPGEIDASDFGAERPRDPLSGNRVVIHRASSPAAAHGDHAICGDIRTPAPWQLVDLVEQSRAAVEQVHGNKEGPARNPIAAIVRHTTNMPELYSRRNAPCFFPLRCYRKRAAAPSGHSILRAPSAKR